MRREEFPVRSTRLGERREEGLTYSVDGPRHRPLLERIRRPPFSVQRNGLPACPGGRNAPTCLETVEYIASGAFRYPRSAAGGIQPRGRILNRRDADFHGRFDCFSGVPETL